MQIVENYNYCIYIKMVMGADSVRDCYDRNFNMYDSAFVTLYNPNMVNVV